MADHVRHASVAALDESLGRTYCDGKIRVDFLSPERVRFDDGFIVLLIEGAWH